MNQTLVIYDNNGKIFTQITGDFVTPIGLQHIITVIPEKKNLVGVDVSGEVHVPIFEDVPPTETEVLSSEVANLNQQLLDIYELMLLGGM